MTQTLEKIQTVDSDGNTANISFSELNHLIKEGDPQGRSFKIYQRKNSSNMMIIMERENKIERRFSYGNLMYEFMIGKNNRVLKGRVYVPGRNLPPRHMVNSTPTESDTIDKIRFGRDYSKSNRSFVLYFY